MKKFVLIAVLSAVACGAFAGKTQVTDQNTDEIAQVTNGKLTTASSLVDTGGNYVDVQHPLPTNGDSVYFKDLLSEECVITGWTMPSNTNATTAEILESFVSDVGIAKENSTTNNPKTILLKFKRPVRTPTFGVNAPPDYFLQNTKIVLKQAGNTVYTLDNSANTNQTPIELASTDLYYVNEIEVTFSTTNTINVGLVGLFKAIETLSMIKGLDEDGVSRIAGVTRDGDLKISDNSSGLAIAKGDVTGSTFESKFGQNDDLDTGAYEDIWDVGGDYNFPTNGTAPITYIDSTDAADTVDIYVKGLDITGALVEQTVTLTGTTPVELPTPLWRCFRLANVGSVDIVGNVQAINTADTVIYAQIVDGNNQTLMCIYTIPLGTVGYLMAGSASIVGLVRSYNVFARVGFRNYGGVFRLQHTFGLISDGSSAIQHFYAIPLPIPALTDIKISAISSVNDGGMNATFDIILDSNQ